MGVRRWNVTQDDAKKIGKIFDDVSKLFDVEEIVLKSDENEIVINIKKKKSD